MPPNGNIPSALFQEILPQHHNDNDDPSSTSKTFVPAYILSPVLPQKCRDLLRYLATEFPTPLTHLKRVRKRNDDKLLSVFIGTVESVDGGATTKADHFDTGCTTSQLSLVSVPARPPRSAAEAEAFTAVWPTRYIPLPPKDPDPLQDSAYVQRLQEGLQWALDHGGAVVVDDTTHTLVATAQREQQQQQSLGNNNTNNPLVTPILLAIQGVSRLEREAILQKNQDSRRYLLTGLDLYTVREPTVMEAMALLHARVRRVVCGDCRQNGGWTTYGIHGLRHTNHRYRAFACRTDTELWKRCRRTSLCDDDAAEYVKQER